MMRAIAVLGALAALAAIGAAADPAPAGAVPPAGIGTQKTVFGEALADSRKMTLYVYDQDGTGGKSACIGTCADDRTPLPAPRIARAVGDWTIVTRDDGSRQWAYKGRPLYGFAGDRAAGDVSGEGGAWHAMIVARGFMPDGVAIRATDYGPTFASGDGRTLYLEVSFVYIAGANGTPRHQGSPAPAACSGDCAKSWAPFTAPADAKPAGDWSTVARDDGTLQWAWKGHPLFTYAGDAKPGDTSGEGNWTLIGNVGTHWEVANIVF